MSITILELRNIIDAVGDEAKKRKETLQFEYDKIKEKSEKLPSLKWFRSRKNADLKDRLAIEGIKRGFSVRAEKVMGALPEYCSKADQRYFNRFDLSWEKDKSSKDFVLVVEIEMDTNTESVMKDFSKLVNNKNNCIKIMICQAKNESEEKALKQAVKKHLSKKDMKLGQYLLSIWAWKKNSFVHVEY